MKKGKIVQLKSLVELVMCLSAFVVSAQNHTFRGKLTGKNNEPVIGATVVVEHDPRHGINTNID